MYVNRNIRSQFFFKFGNEFCERFSFYGLKGTLVYIIYSAFLNICVFLIYLFLAILVLFFVAVQKYDNQSSMTIYNMFLVFTYISPFVVAIIADSYWENYK